jgi:ubiquinone/menaquinone biosynthesis C-methylase UbiE
MEANPNLPTWDEGEFVAEWVNTDVVASMLTLPRQISAALVADAEVPVSHVIDLGSGPGAYLETLLHAFPRARGTWVDSSDSMEEIAREKLAPLEGRIEYHLAEIESLAELGLQPGEIVLTSRVVHHLSPEAIQQLYTEVHELILPGGFFFNLDHFGAPADWEERYRRIRPQFTGPRTSDIPAHRHDYPFSPIGDHLGWLEQAGFATTDVPWRTFYSALLAAQRG